MRSRPRLSLWMSQEKANSAIEGGVLGESVYRRKTMLHMNG